MTKIVLQKTSSRTRIFCKPHLSLLQGDEIDSKHVTNPIKKFPHYFKLRSFLHIRVGFAKIFNQSESAKAA